MYVDYLSEFFDGVIPTYERYVELSNKRDLKKSELKSAAINSANSLFHYREVLEPMFPKNGLTRYVVAGLCPDFDWIGDVSNAAKHISTRGKIVNHKSQIEETIVWTLFPFNDQNEYPREYFSIIEPRIIINPLPKKGNHRDLLEIATSVINFWGDFLLKQNFTDKRVVFHYAGNDIHKRNIGEIDEAKSQVLMFPSYDNKIRVAYRGRFYEPKSSKFEEAGFNLDGSIVALPIWKTKGLHPRIYGWWDI